MGHGLLNVAYTDIVTATLSVRDRGVAGSLSLLTRTLGIVSGASVLTALHAAGAAGLSGIDGFLAGYRYAFLAAGGGLLVALVLSLAVPRAWSRTIRYLGHARDPAGEDGDGGLERAVRAAGRLQQSRRLRLELPFVRHTLSMDTTFPDNALKGRAITSPDVWTLGYWRSSWSKR